MYDKSLANAAMPVGAGTLAVTGFDIWTVVVIAVVLIAVGALFLMVRKHSKVLSEREKET